VTIRSKQLGFDVALSIATVAALEAMPGPLPAAPQTYWAQEFQANYVFVAGSVAVVDHYTVLGVTGGVAGRWLLNGTQISLAPIDGAVDDVPRFYAAVNALASIGGSVLLRNGPTGQQFQFKTVTTVGFLTNACVYGAPDVTVISTIVHNDGFNNAPFKIVAPENTVGGDLGLNATCVVGSTTMLLNSVAGLAVGGYLWIGSADAIAATQYKIKAIVPGVPNTVTVERPILWPWIATGNPHAATVYPSTPAVNVRIFGNGMTIRGTGDRAIEFIGAIDLLVVDINVISETRNAVAGFDGFAVGFDNANVRNAGRNIRVDAGGQAICGISLESVEDAELAGCFIENVLKTPATGNAGVYIYESRNVVLQDTNTSECFYGIVVDYEDGAVGSFFSSDNIVISGCTGNDNAASGCWVSGGATNVKIVASSFERNGTAGAAWGIFINDGGIRLGTSVTCLGCTTSNNTGGGLSANSTGVVKIGDHTSDGNSVQAVNLNAGCSLVIDGLSAIGNAYGIQGGGGNLVGTGIYISGNNCLYAQGGTWSISDAIFRNGTAAGAIAATFYNAAGFYQLDGIQFISDSGNMAFCIAEENAGIVLQLGKVTTTGTPGTGFFSNAGRVLRAADTDFSGCTTPWSVTAAGLANFGSGLVATGALQTVNAACKASDMPVVFMATASAGTGASLPLVALADGSFNVTFAAGDRSTYAWSFAA